MTPQIKIKNKILEQEQKMKKSMMSNASSVVPSQFENSDDGDECRENPANGETFDVGEDAVVGNVAQLQFSKFASKRPPTGSGAGSSTEQPAQIPPTTTASRKPIGLTVDTTKSKFGAQKPQISDFSPMTPGKGIAVRFGVNKGNADALKSPHLPPVSTSGGAGAIGSGNKSSFYKKAMNG